MDRTQDPTTCFLQETHFNFTNTNRLFLASRNQKRTGVAVLIPDKSGVNSKSDKRWDHYIMIKRSSHQADIIIINIYEP